MRHIFWCNKWFKANIAINLDHNVLDVWYKIIYTTSKHDKFIVGPKSFDPYRREQKIVQKEFTLRQGVQGTRENKMVLTDITFPPILMVTHSKCTSFNSRA